MLFKVFSCSIKNKGIWKFSFLFTRHRKRGFTIKIKLKYRSRVTKIKTNRILVILLISFEKFSLNIQLRNLGRQ